MPTAVEEALQQYNIVTTNTLITKFFCAMRKRVCSSLIQLSMMAKASSNDRPLTYSRSITDNVNAAPYPCAPYDT